MAVNVTSAIGAYKQVIDRAGSPGMEARAAQPGKSFQDLMTDIADTVAETGAEADHQTKLAVTGKADLNEVVMAVANADVALQTVVAVRDRVIQAYQDILRMPI